VWRSNYGRLFAPGAADEETTQTTDATVDREGGGGGGGGDGSSVDTTDAGNLVFAFKPDLSGLLTDTASPEGSDGWALDVGVASVTPYLTSYAELPESEHGFGCVQDREWKFLEEKA
jgi:hypothetical protein